MRRRWRDVQAVNFAGCLSAQTASKRVVGKQRSRFVGRGVLGTSILGFVFVDRPCDHPGELVLHATYPGGLKGVCALKSLIPATASLCKSDNDKT